MWPNLTTYISEILKKPKSQVPTSSPFSTVKSAVLNILTTAQTGVFHVNSSSYEAIPTNISV